MQPVKDIRKEILIEALLIKRIVNAGGVCEKVASLSGRGYFDRLVVFPGGRVVFVEVKRPSGGVVSPHQRERIEKYKKLGAEVALISSEADIDRVFAPASRKEKPPRR